MGVKRGPVGIEINPAPVEQKSLFEQAEGHLQANDWRHYKNEEGHFYRMPIPLKAAMTDLILDVWQGDEAGRILVLVVFPFFVPEHRRGDILEAINRINFSLNFGGFEMDPRDGELRWKAYLQSGPELDSKGHERAMGSALGIADNHLAPLLGVAFGGLDPKAILDMTPAATGETIQ